MIRITIELVPDGINVLKQTADRVVIASRFPLNDDSQDFYIFGDDGRRYAETTGYNMTENIYFPKDGKPKWLELAYMAIGELLKQKTTRPAGGYFPGLAGLETVEFDIEISDLVKDQKQNIQSIRLFGKRVREEINFPNFANALAKRIDETGGADGLYLLKNYPGYIPYDLAIRLDPKLYKPEPAPIQAGERTFKSWGEVYEMKIILEHCLRPMPHIPDMVCFNGLLIYFLRPDGSIANPTIETLITKRRGAHVAISGEYGAEYDYTLESLKAEIKAGRILYSKRTGLVKYPGVKD